MAVSSRPTRRVLVVEDNAGDVRLVRESLRERDLDIQMDVVGDGRDALHHVREQRPDLVLLDLNLPGLHGHEVLQQIRHDPATRSTPVVIMSSSGEAPDRESTEALDAQRYIVKPGDYRSFIEIVGQTVEQLLEETS